ncbi:BCN_G0043620.mRNA.1.CDS.1 [Saccharomyces cerevisiae]|nr:BCE_3a_G0028560.mRNA.1.CDS.1 [Saccharomyces cerevisiae]CAI4584820.1 BCE_3a_G0031950.mRNA.1.CDS.1 [Saccharomyces cerevisiae]CAI4689795.1 BCN_G0043620.mRNA.1.CDS.1 [Saccharomyces cerevisiae]CAI4719548.1 BCE_3a_G0043610.mRNA.1.CDS.1 [Saccharomyces cerevisiae]CAI5302530.1 ALI_HP2_G0043020.mRNA.1.CDS.1 [Saccharomyces cerevisiae]
MLQYIPLSNLPYSHTLLHGPCLTISTKCTHIIMHGTCLSGLYPVPFTYNTQYYPRFNIYNGSQYPNYHVNTLNSMRNGPFIQISTTHFMYTSVVTTK